MHNLSTALIAGIALIALAATLGASEVLVRGVGRLARNLGLFGGIVGLIIALGADSPEVSSAVVATANGSAATGIGVVVGSNIFNIAILLGAATFAAGELRVHWSSVTIDAGVSIVVTAALGACMLGIAPLAVGWAVLLPVFISYVFFLGLRSATLERLRLPSPVRTFLSNASREAGEEGEDLGAELEERGVGRSPPRSWRPVVLVIPAVVIIALGSLLLVQSALTLGQRWNVSGAVIGIVILAAATSLPNAYAATRLAIDGRGASVVSATFNSNTLNLIAGFAVPALFFRDARVPIPPSFIVWLLGMSVLALVFLAQGLRKPGALLLVAGYALFVVYAIVVG